MISVIIPTYKSSDALDLCLKSAIEGQQYKNQIIVVVDGFYELNKEVLEKYKGHVDILNLEQNVGLCRGTNLGVYNAKFNRVLIVNDDNVFPDDWDYKLTKYKLLKGMVLTPNQIEPYPSMFKQFHIKDLGKTPEEFDLDEFWEYEKNLSQSSKTKYEHAGSTLPIFMDKSEFIAVGGWDENYEMGLVADWDFFLKCNLLEFKLIRSYECHFYHFASISVKGEERKHAEIRAHEYAKYKWNSYINHDPETNKKFLCVEY